MFNAVGLKLDLAGKFVNSDNQAPLES